MVKLVERKKEVIEYVLGCNHEELNMLLVSVMDYHERNWRNWATDASKHNQDKVANYYSLRESLRDIIECRND
jgi:hypothetical protein